MVAEPPEVAEFDVQDVIESHPRRSILIPHEAEDPIFSASITGPVPWTGCRSFRVLEG